jgi:hypothetical protein
MADTRELKALLTVFASDAKYDATDALRNGSGDDTLAQTPAPNGSIKAARRSLRSFAAPSTA